MLHIHAAYTHRENGLPAKGELPGKTDEADPEPGKGSVVIAVATAVICLCLCGSARAAPPKHGIQVGLDIAAQSVRDDTLVPLAYGGLRLALAPRYFADAGFGQVLADRRMGIGC